MQTGQRRSGARWLMSGLPPTRLKSAKPFWTGSQCVPGAWRRSGGSWRFIRPLPRQTSTNRRRCRHPGRIKNERGLVFTWGKCELHGMTIVSPCELHSVIEIKALAVAPVDRWYLVWYRCRCCRLLMLFTEFRPFFVVLFFSNNSRKNLEKVWH